MIRILVLTLFALGAAAAPARAQSSQPSEQPLTLDQVLERGFEIKAASTAVIDSVPHEQIYLQKDRSAFICILRHNAGGKFAQLGCFPIR
jgi:hypothetical protein